MFTVCGPDWTSLDVCEVSEGMKEGCDCVLCGGLALPELFLLQIYFSPGKTSDESFLDKTKSLISSFIFNFWILDTQSRPEWIRTRTRLPHSPKMLI